MLLWKKTWWTPLWTVSHRELWNCGAVSLGCPQYRENIPFGNKFALRDIAAGEKIIKYGVPIAVAAKDILQGTYVHTHNAKSMLDMKSNRWEGSE